MSNWPLSEVRTKIAEFARSGVGGDKLLKVIAHGNTCAPIECDQLDFKRQVNDDEIGIAETCRDVAAFFNMYGGYIIVGVKENGNETFEVIGAETGFDIERIKNKIKDFTGERVLITQQKCGWQIAPKHVVQLFILNIPGRGRKVSPLSFSKDGPCKGIKGKPIFLKGDIPIREGDETTTARGQKVMEIWDSRPHPLLSETDGKTPTPLARVDHNLPDRNIICPQVMGRKDALEHLWRWLPDDLAHVKVLAGEGGIGKSSVAYEFADHVSLLSCQIFEQVRWLSAKQRQFRPLTNSYTDMAETHFATYDELLDKICDLLPITEEERIDSNRSKKLRLIKQGFEVTPSFIVIDDIDSLDVSEQRQALELGFLLSGTKTKLLLTTRNNIIYSGDICYTVRGIEKQEFPGFFNALMLRFPSPTRIVPKSAEVDRIWEVSKGSPLFAESILRLLAYQNVGEAIGHWRGEDGDDVRKAALLREINQLSVEARRILLTLALLSEASLAELVEVSGYNPVRVADAVQNLSSLYLVEAPKLAGENRIRVSETTGRLVLSIRRELAADHVRLEKAIRDFRAGAADGQQTVGIKLVGAAILQASALERQGRVPEALETLIFATKKVAKGKRGDLLAYVGYLHSKKIPAEFDLSRTACRAAFNEDCFKPRLFETWFNSEWELGNFPGTEEVARTVLEKRIEPIYEWRIRLAASLISKAQAQGGGRISISVLPAYFEASKELSEAIALAPYDEAQKWRGSLEDANDSIYRASADEVVTPSDRLSVARSLLIFIRQGDVRIRNYARILGLIEDLLMLDKKKSNTGLSTATRSIFEDVQQLLQQRTERYPNDERHESLVLRCSAISTEVFSPNIGFPRLDDASYDSLDKNQPSEKKSLSRHETLLDDVRVSSAIVDITRPPLPDHLSLDRRSRHYVKECFDYQIGIRLNGKDRSDVKEYCLSEGWVMVPAGKTVDRQGKPLLIKLKGNVEAFYKNI